MPTPIKVQIKTFIERMANECRYCESDDIGLSVSDPLTNYIYCLCCGTRGPRGKSAGDAIDKWNGVFAPEPAGDPRVDPNG